MDRKQIQEELDRLPPELRAKAAELIAQGGDKVAGVKVVSVDRLTGERVEEDSFAGKTPIRSVKMSKRVAEVNAEVKAFITKASAESKRLDAAKKKLLDDAQELKSRLWAHVSVDMGLNLSRYEMRINDETNEVEIMTDNRAGEAASKTSKKK